MSNSLRPQGLQHTRFPCPSPSPGESSNSGLLSWWYYPIFSSSVIPFFSWLQSFPALGSFPMSWLFTSGGQSTEASTSAPVLPINIQSWFPLGFRFDLWAFQGSLESLLQHILKALIFRHSTFFMVQLWHPYMTTEKNVALTIWTFVFINEGDAKTFLGFPWWLRQLRICMKFRRHIFSPWLGKIPWKIKWLQTPVFMPRRFHFQRNLAG